MPTQRPGMERRVFDLPIRLRIPSFSANAKEKLAAGDFSLFQSDALKCAIPPVRHQDFRQFPIMSLAALGTDNAVRALTLREAYAEGYNRTVIADSRYPFKDICTTDKAAPTEPTEILRSLAPNSAQDDGTIYGAVRAGNQALALTRAKSSPDAIAKPDSIFGATPLDWAIYKNRQDIASALLQKVKADRDATNLNVLRATALEAVLGSGNIDMLDWVLTEVQPDPLTFPRTSARPRFADIEAEYGYGIAHKIVSYILHHPKANVANQMRYWISNESDGKQSRQMVSYILGSDRVFQDCRSNGGGWNKGCSTLEYLTISGPSEDAAIILDRFQPTPQQMRDIIAEAIRSNQDRNLQILLERNFDRNGLKQSLVAEPIGGRGAFARLYPALPRQRLENGAQESDEAYLVRQEQESRAQTARRAAELEAEQNIINLLLKAGFTRQEITGIPSSKRR